MQKKDEYIPENVIEDLKLKEKEIPESSKIIVESHQTSVKIPRETREELHLPLGSTSCTVLLKDNNTLIVKIKRKS